MMTKEIKQAIENFYESEKGSFLLVGFITDEDQYFVTKKNRSIESFIDNHTYRILEQINDTLLSITGEYINQIIHADDELITLIRKTYINDHNNICLFLSAKSNFSQGILNLKMNKLQKAIS